MDRTNLRFVVGKLLFFSSFFEVVYSGIVFAILKKSTFSTFRGCTERESNEVFLCSMAHPHNMMQLEGGLKHFSNINTISYFHSTSIFFDLFGVCIFEYSMPNLEKFDVFDFFEGVRRGRGQGANLSTQAFEYNGAITGTWKPERRKSTKMGTKTADNSGNLGKRGINEKKKK